MKSRFIDTQLNLNTPKSGFMDTYLKFQHKIFHGQEEWAYEYLAQIQQRPWTQFRSSNTPYEWVMNIQLNYNVRGLEYNWNWFMDTQLEYPTQLQSKMAQLQLELFMDTLLKNKGWSRPRYKGEWSLWIPNSKQCWP